MYLEQVILDERLDISANQVEDIISQFIFHYIIAPLDMDLTFEQEGNKQILVIRPEDRTDGKPEKLINGYIEISPISLNRDLKPVQVRIVSCRDELTPLWYDLAQYLKASILVPLLPVNVLITPLKKQTILQASSIEGLLDPSSSTVSKYPSLPSKPSALRRWKSGWKEIKNTRKKFWESFNDGDTNNPTPTIDELREALEKVYSRTPSDRTVESIIAAGEAGLLD